MPIYPHNFGPRIDAIEDREVKKMAEQVLVEMKLGILKGAAHGISTGTYPVSQDLDSVENMTVRFLSSRPQAKQDKVKASVKKILDQPPLYMKNMFGPLSAVNLKSSKTVTEQVKALGLDRNNQIRLSSLRNLEIKNNRLIRSTPHFTSASVFEPVHEGFVLEHALPELVVRDPIIKKYGELGGSSGFLGNPVGGKGRCPDGKGRFQHYEHGSIYWSPVTGAHEIHGSIREKWKSLGWETSFLGYPLTDELTAPDGTGKYTHFQGGSIYWTPGTGAHEVHGAIRNKWAAMGWEKSYLGYPITDETKTPDTVGRFSHFEGGSIYWTPKTGAQAVHKNIRDKWKSTGWELGYLGYPINDTVVYMHPSSMVSRFQGGEIVWNSSSGATDTMPFSKLRFRIHKVKCLDETNPEWGGDKINLGGVACSINDANTTKINAFRVHSDFDDGEQKVYNPPKEFYTFNLKDIPGWSKSFTVTMALAEIDSGGFNDFLKKLLIQIRDKVISYIKEKAAGLTGAALGVYLGTAVGGIVGAIVGALVGWILGELFDWLIGLFDDDVFPGWTAQFVLPSVWHRWGGYTDSPQGSFWTQAHGGKYKVWFDWQLLA